MTIVSRRRRTVDVDADLMTDDDEQLAVSPILQPFVIPNSQIAYVSITLHR